MLPSAGGDPCPLNSTEVTGPSLFSVCMAADNRQTSARTPEENDPKRKFLFGGQFPYSESKEEPQRHRGQLSVTTGLRETNSLEEQSLKLIRVHRSQRRRSPGEPTSVPLWLFSL